MTPVTITLHHQNQAHVVYELRWHSQLNDDYVIEATLDKTAIQHPKNQLLMIHLQDKLGPEQWLQGWVVETRAHDHQAWITLVMHSPCWPLRNNMRSGVYYDATVQKVIAHNQHHPLPLIDRTQAGRHDRYPAQKSLTQYQQSDWDFLASVLQRFGIWQVFWQRNQQVQWIAGDDNACFWRPEVPFCQWQNVRTISSLGSLPRYLIGSHHDSLHDRVYRHQICLNPYGEGNTQWHSPFANLTDTQCAVRIEAIAQEMRCHSQRFSAEFCHAFLQAGMLLADGRLITSVTQHFVAAQRGKGGALLYQATQHAEGLVLQDNAYYPLFPQNLPRYNGVLIDGLLHAEADIVMPDHVGNVPLRLPYSYQWGSARMTPVVDKVNQGKQGLSGPHYADALCQVVFAQGNLDQPLIMGVCNQATSSKSAVPAVRQTHYGLPTGQSIVMTNQAQCRNHLTFCVLHDDGSKTQCHLNGDMLWETPYGYQHDISDRLHLSVAKMYQCLVEV